MIVAEGVESSSLRDCVSPEHSKELLTPDFGMVKNIIKKASNGKVIKVRKFRIVERRNFNIWAIAIRSHL
jgi:hypothetical protein